MNGIRLRHLAFTGTTVDVAVLEFDDGLNIVYGASNTGKSFAAEAILFMLGATKRLPDIEQLGPYDSAWLGVTLADEGDFTLYRATGGGHFKLYPGLVKNAPSAAGQALQDEHNRNRTNTISHRLLDAIGLAGKWVARDGDGTKVSLSIRLLSKYAVVSEDDILAKKSPVYMSGAPAERSLERNLFKLLLTGKDDVAAVTVPKEAERKVAKAAKIELVDEMLAQLDAQLGKEAPDENVALEQLGRLDESAGALLDRLQATQTKLDALVSERRDTLDRVRELQERWRELDLTLQRFAKLQAVYTSDLERLQSIEEGGFVLVAMAGRDCPVCGAPPGAQTHNHAADDILMAHAAAAAEVRKIEREQRELGHVVVSLNAEATGLRRTIDQLNEDADALSSSIQQLRPDEASLRTSYEIYNTTRSDVVRLLDLYQRRALLSQRREEIGATSTRREGEAAPAGPDSTTIFDFGEKVKAVLQAWRFPDADKVQFDGKTNDITIGGKARAANGKGVRAILHAAFNVALVVHCIDNDLPHPGFLVLDTPLLTYREPLEHKHGDLSEDEKALKSTSLAEHFYRHLASLSNHLQVIVIENIDPPPTVKSMARIEVFTAKPGSGRYGMLANLG